MADEIIENEDIEIDDISTEEDNNANDNKLEVDTEDVPNSEGNKPDDGESVVKKAMQKLGLMKGEESEGEDELEEIPQTFVDAAIAQGWTEKEIIEFTENYTNDELLEILPDLYDEADDLEPDDGPAKHEETPKHQKESDIPKDAVEAFKEEMRKEFQKEIDELKEKLSIVDAEKEQARSQAVLTTINRVFDEVGEQFEVFGKTSELPVYPAGSKKGQYVMTSPQMKARSEVLRIADPLYKSGMDIEEAMQTALTWYKGQNLEKDIQAKVIKGLKRNEKKLSAKRSSKETVPTFEDEEEYKRDFIRREAEKRGIKLIEE